MVAEDCTDDPCMRSNNGIDSPISKVAAGASHCHYRWLLRQRHGASAAGALNGLKGSKHKKLIYKEVKLH